MTKTLNNVIKFPTRGKLQDCPLALKVSSEEVQEVVACATRNQNVALADKFKAVLATAEKGECLLAIEEAIEMADVKNI